MMMILSMISGEWVLSGQSAENNYIEERTSLTKNGDQVRSEIHYYDGLGRPIETVQKGAWIMNGTAYGDITSRQEYDSAGRLHKTWLPVGFAGGEGDCHSSSEFQSSACNFYNNTYPYSEVFYDGSPLDRKNKERGAGREWYEGNVATAYRYLTNLPYGGEYELRPFSISYVGGSVAIIQKGYAFLPTGSSSVVETTDEDGRKTMIFSDMFGKTLLTRGFVKDSLGIEHRVDTYYCYNLAGQLEAVLPPMLASFLIQSNASTFTSLSTPEIGRYAFLYRYDDRGRLIAKKLPGAEWIYYVYDEGDHLVYSQDGELRKTGEWSFSIPDRQGRECLSGTITLSLDPFSDPLSDVWVDAQKSYPLTETGSYGYAVQGANVSNATIMTVNWYDDYSYLGHFGIPSATPVSHTRFDSSLGEQYGEKYEYPSGLLTGKMERVLGNTGQSQYIWEVLYYDDRGRVVQKTSSTHRGGMDRTNVGYDFVGNPLRERIIHVDSQSGRQVAELRQYEYDAWGRPVKTLHSVGTWLVGGTIPFTGIQTFFPDTVCLHHYEYDQVGRLSIDRRNGTEALRAQFSYNIRSWLKSIKVGGNAQQGTLGETFTEKLYYNVLRTGAPSTLRQWGGNISSQEWMTGNDGVSRSYDYTYDGLSRLVDAIYDDDATNTGAYDRSYSYDQNGNLLSMGTPLTNTTLMYEGNQLTRLESVPAGGLLRHGPIGDPVLLTEYDYDANGNQTMDVHRGIQSMSYNEIGRPKRVVTGGSGLFLPSVRNYLYSASGDKLQVVDSLPGLFNNRTQTDYVGNLIYRDGALKTILVDGGYVEVTDTSMHYRFFVADHLGSNRMVTDASGTILSVNHFGPYGESLSAGSGASSGSPYKYSGKEYDSSLQSYDFGARDFVPSVPRWTTMDPLAEKYYSISPYAYCRGNPVKYIDYLGKDIYRFDKETGDFVLYKRTKDNYDVVGKFKKDKNGSYNLKQRKNGTPKVKTGHIEKGILENGVNFKNQDHVFNVSSNGGPSLKGVETFLIELTSLAQKEVGGYYYSELGDGVVSHISIGMYKNNESHKTKAHGRNSLVKAFPDSYSDSKVVGVYHTHPHDLHYPNRFTGSPGDLKNQARQRESYPWLRFFVLTEPSYGQEQYKFEY